ncbi:hypothetical protein HK102_011677, partial [Quaeritorhiza haematococci]
QTCPNLAGGRSQAYFVPTPWLLGGHLQTFWAALTSKRPNFVIKYEREVIHTHDGGNIALDWSPGPIPQKGSNDTTPTIVVLHGLTGASTDTYVMDLAHEVLKHNQPHPFEKGVSAHSYRVVVANFRGCGNTVVTSPQLYCGAYTDDIRFAVRHIRTKLAPDTPLLGVGFSLGANIMLKYVGEEGPNCPFIACVPIANPFDLLHGSRLMHKSILGKYVYSRRMTQNLIGVYKKHMHAFEGTTTIDHQKVFKAKTLTEFDDACTRLVFKFRTVDEYYRKGSSGQYVPDVAIPTLLLSAIDDPVAT